MSCVKLYVDIIVASEIYRHIQIEKLLRNKRFDNKKGKRRLLISIEDCIDAQEDYKGFGLGYVFTGNNEKNWEIKDYIYFFNKFPQYFKFVDIWNKNKIAISESFFDEQSFEEITGIDVCNKLLQRSYSIEVLGALGLLD